MGKLTRLEERGRILLPRHLREELKLRVGQRLLIEREREKIVIKPVRDVRTILGELRCSVKRSLKVKPDEVKKIWEKK